MIKILPRGRIRLPLPETFAYMTHSVRMSLGVYGISALGVEALSHGSILPHRYQWYLHLMYCDWLILDKIFIWVFVGISMWGTMLTFAIPLWSFQLVFSNSHLKPSKPNTYTLYQEK